MPFVNTRLTRVTLLTGATPTSLDKSHSSAEGNQSESLGQYLNSKTSDNNCILGVSDYKHSKTQATNKEWEKLEKQAAIGVGGVLHENFRPSVLVMDENTDNSSHPVVVVNGKCVK